MGDRNSEPRNGAKEFLTVAPLSPRSGALQLTTGTHGSRPGLGCFALRAWRFGWGYAAMRGGQSCPQPAFNRRPPSVLRYSQTVHLNLQEMVDADAVDAVGLRHGAALWLRMHRGAVDHEVDLVGAHAHFEGVDGLPVCTRFRHHIVGRL